MAEEKPDSGGNPEALAKCSDCGEVYPVRWSEEKELQVVGTGGTCQCGSTEFEAIPEGIEP